MSIIRTHDITLYGGSNIGLVLRPFTDVHLPYLYKWCTDPEVTYWTEGGKDNTNILYQHNVVQQIYGEVSQNAFCFLLEADHIPIGQCRLQKMNLPEVLAKYPVTMDVRRIDLSIGEKAYWGKGIGTQCIGMMVDFAFYGEHVDVLHCLCENCNARSRRIWEKYGFTQVLAPQPQKGKWQYHYCLTRQDFIARRRMRIPQEKQFMVPLDHLQPSQLYISEGKLRIVQEWFDPNQKNALDPIPVKQINRRFVMTDGHTRAVAAYLSRWSCIPAYWDEDMLDMRLYEIDVKWCDEEGIYTPAELAGRIVPHKDYERLWRKRCMEMSI